MPNPAVPFEGVIADTLADSTPHWVERPRPPADAPNVVLVLLDDTGFAQLGCYGSSIDTPNIDRLAARGLRYNNFHTTAMCSPTRASLLTGRNHHSVGVGAIMEMATGFPGYDCEIPKSAATVAEVLRRGGYNTWALGKWHLVPDWKRSIVGPYDNWPVAMGFERYYGFMGADTDQFSPTLYRDNHRVETPASSGGTPGYHVSEDLIDEAIGLVNDQTSVDPTRPFFCYVGFGATHAPHQVPSEYIERYAGRFDQGWDVERERILERQVTEGIVPPGTELAPVNRRVQAWADLSGDEKRLFARMHEVYAGFLAHTDEQIGRLIDAVDAAGRLDDTVFIVLSDNGASPEGDTHGRFSEMTLLNGVEERLEDILPRIDELGGPSANSHYPMGWAQAGNTPLKRYKQFTHGGGIRDPFVIAWPNGIDDAGSIRTQYHHVADVAPMILELAGIDPPEAIDGVQQQPVEGVSMAYSLTDAQAPSPKQCQYYEMMGSRAIWSEGWKAVCPVQRRPLDEQRWELYDIEHDFAELHDLAGEHPDKLAELIELWWREAQAHHVLPMADGFERLLAERPPAIPVRDVYTYLPGITTVPEGVTHDVRRRPHAITAFVTIDHPGPIEGVLFAQGGRFGGFSLYLQDGRLHYVHNRAGTRCGISAPVDLDEGDHVLRFECDDRGGAGDGALFVDGVLVAEGPLPHLVSMRYAFDEGFDVGRDTTTPVTDDYACPFAFTATLHRVEVAVGGTALVDPQAEVDAAIARQ
ncbi:MAG TPA: arylsulfatase [Acidimicrobiales bacterium]|nr:arylsulfatase [Acidimicrobiales bacterium]